MYSLDMLGNWYQRRSKGCKGSGFPYKAINPKISISLVVYPGKQEGKEQQKALYSILLLPKTQNIIHFTCHMALFDELSIMSYGVFSHYIHKIITSFPRGVLDGIKIKNIRLTFF